MQGRVLTLPHKTAKVKIYFCIRHKQWGMLAMDEAPKVSLHRDGGHAQPQGISSSVSPVRCEQRAQRVKKSKVDFVFFPYIKTPALSFRKMPGFFV